jgi:hypothetical protein
MDMSDEIIERRGPSEEDLRLARYYEARTKLEEIDRKAGAGRAVRACALEAAEMTNAVYSEDYERLRGLENQAEAIRAEMEAASGAGGQE